MINSVSNSAPKEMEMSGDQSLYQVPFPVLTGNITHHRHRTSPVFEPPPYLHRGEVKCVWALGI